MRFFADENIPASVVVTTLSKHRNPTWFLFLLSKRQTAN